MPSTIGRPEYLSHAMQEAESRAGCPTEHGGFVPRGMFSSTRCNDCENAKQGNTDVHNLRSTHNNKSETHYGNTGHGWYTLSSLDLPENASFILFLFNFLQGEEELKS